MPPSNIKESQNNEYSAKSSNFNEVYLNVPQNLSLLF